MPYSTFFGRSLRDVDLPDRRQLLGGPGVPGLVPQEPAPEGGTAGRLPTSAAVSLQLVVAVGQLAMGLLEGRLQRHVLQDDRGQESSAGALWKGWWTQSVALWKGWWT